MSLPVARPEGAAHTWNSKHVWSLAKGTWRSAVVGTHGGAYPYAFTAGGGNKNQCLNDVTWGAWAPWVILHAVSEPEHTGWKDNKKALDIAPVHYMKKP